MEVYTSKDTTAQRAAIIKRTSDSRADLWKSGAKRASLRWLVAEIEWLLWPLTLSDLRWRLGHRDTATSLASDLSPSWVGTKYRPISSTSDQAAITWGGVRSAPRARIIPTPAAGDRIESRRTEAGWISGIVFVCIIVSFNLLWTRFVTPAPSASWFDFVQRALFFSWLLALPQTLLNLQGFLFTRPQTPLFTLASVRDALRTPLHVRIVTHGTNLDVVQKTLEADAAVIDAFTKRYGIRPRVVVEVVTDNALPIDARQYAVTPDFTTPHGALFKARALQYAVKHVPVNGDAWILHCDEETQLTLSGLMGCLRFMQQEIDLATPGRLPAIGQGTILYHRDFWSRPFMTLADSIRTAMDFGYFRVQYHVWHRPLLGVHGSFILCRQDIERVVDFDFDSYRSITEDAYWALLLVERGIRIKWTHGFLSEQATFGVMDFLRQRRRWFTGLWHVLSGENINWRTTLVLRLAVLSWSCAFMGTLAILLQLFHPIFVPWYIILLSSLSMATYTSITVYGLLVNLRELPLDTRGITWLIVLAQVSLMPVFGLMETAALLWGLMTINRVGFHVVKK